MKGTRVMVGSRAGLTPWQGGIVVLMFALAGLFMAAWIYAPSPYRQTGPDYVEPLKARAGDEFVVYRTFDWLRADESYVERTMLRRDCRTECTVYKLESGFLNLPTGHYDRLGRPQTIPSDVKPGLYDLIYVLFWKNFIGREVSEHLPLLQVEVLP